MLSSRAYVDLVVCGCVEGHIGAFRQAAAEAGVAIIGKDMPMTSISVLHI